MSVQTSVESRSYEVTARFVVEGAGRRAMPYGSSQSYRPTGVTITYFWSSGDTDQSATVALTGPRLLKDEREGQEIKRETLWSRDEWPDWVKALVEEHRPAVKFA